MDGVRFQTQTWASLCASALTGETKIIRAFSYQRHWAERIFTWQTPSDHTLLPD
jgi:phage-related protein